MKRYFKFAAVAVCALALGACADEISVGKTFDESPYSTLGENNAWLLDTQTGRAENIVELYGEHSTNLKVGLTKAAAGNVAATIKIDPNWLNHYNDAHGTKYTHYPISAVTLSGNGSVSIATGEKEAATVAMTITKINGLDTTKEYAVPVVLTVSSGDVTLKESVSYCLYVIKDTGVYSANDANKGEGLPKGFVFINNHNPLNALSYELENGKLLWDVVCLFSANINYNSVEGRPYLTKNAEIKFALENYAKVVKPLQDRGVKVVLGLLGNHDAAGLAQLSDAGAKDFAAEVAATIYTYGLDGVCLDDEYSAAPDLNNPAFTTRSYAAAARLCYELKQAMPDKLVTIYEWGAMYASSFPATVEDKTVDQYVDFSVADYAAVSTTTDTFGKAKGSGVSMELSMWAKDSNLHLMAGVNNLVSTSNPEGYTWFVGFAPTPDHYVDPFSANGGTVDGVFKRLYKGVEAIYGVPLKKPTVYYNSLDATPYVFNYPQDKWDELKN